MKTYLPVGRGGVGLVWVGGWVRMLRILTNVCNNRARSGSTIFYTLRPGCHFEREGGAT